jgi:predicted HTH domain antitoxin
MTYALKLPQNVEVSNFEIQMIVASKLYEQGKLSSGQAAEVVGVTKRTFLEMLGKYNVSIFNYSIEEKEEVLIDKETAIAIIKAGCDMSSFGDAMEYQQEIRKDRVLPFRE